MKLNGDYVQDMAELQQCECYSWGENLLLVKEANGDRSRYQSTACRNDVCIKNTMCL